MVSISESKIWATAKTCFSPMQSRLLSKAPPVDDRSGRVFEAGRGVDDDRGIARPGDDRALLAGQGGPRDGRAAGDDQEPDGLVVEQGRRRLERGRVDDREQVFDADRLADRLVEPAHALGGDPAPEGWALKTTVLPAASMLIALPASVGRLCVTGVIAPMTPKGT